MQPPPPPPARPRQPTNPTPKQTTSRPNNQPAQAASAAPKPNERFSRADLKRIKQQGPTVDDLFAQKSNEVQIAKGKFGTSTESFIPYDVLGGAEVTLRDGLREPFWPLLAEMNYMQFYHELQRRNWTSKHFDASAEPWKVRHELRQPARHQQAAPEGAPAFARRLRLCLARARCRLLRCPTRGLCFLPPPARGMGRWSCASAAGAC
jgi:hypothetical protein